MATVTGLTADRMLELALEWEQVQEAQATTDGAVSQLANNLGAANNVLVDLVNTQIPNLSQDLSDAKVTINDLNDNTVPNLRTDLDNITGVSIPGVVSDIEDHINSETPHPVYDDGPSLALLYENAKV